MGIIWTIIIGFVAGIIAKFLHPGPNEPSGFILTTILGIIGAFVATYLGQTPSASCRLRGVGAGYWEGLAPTQGGDQDVVADCRSRSSGDRNRRRRDHPSDPVRPGHPGVVHVLRRGPHAHDLSARPARRRPGRGAYSS